MRRTKPPVLTSPWKIGFFVSLMLLVVSTGVAYFFMKTFGLSLGLDTIEWSWEWIKNELLAVIAPPLLSSAKGPLARLIPLLLLVAVTTIISFLLITAAVRKYKRYLDSGHDYKNLLSSIRQIDDLENSGQIDKLKYHPELKSFLINVRDTLAARSRDLDAREKALESAAATAVVEGGDPEFAEECARLADAVWGQSANDFPGDLELTQPELKRIEEAVRSAFKNTGDGAGKPADLVNSLTGLKTAADAMRNRIAGIADELTENGHGAKEVETRLSQMGQESSGLDNGDLQGQLETILKSAKAMDTLSTSLGVLSEEAKGTAISAAMQAGSGTGTAADMVEMAEDLKEIAVRFGDLSKSYITLTGKLKGAVNHLGAHSDQQSAGGRPGPSLDAVAGKVSLLVERMVVMADKIKNLQASYDLAVEAIEIPDPGSTTDAGGGAEDRFQSTDLGIESLGGDRDPLFSGQGASPMDMPGLERDGAAAFDNSSSSSSEDDHLFADLSEESQSTPPGSPRIDPDAFRDAPVRKEAPPTPPATPSLDVEGFESFTSSLKPRSAPSTESATPNGEEDGAIDLYALGAVDYDPTIHG